MATLTIRNLDDQVHARLRERADAHGRSMEAEARLLLAESVQSLTRDQKLARIRALQSRVAGLLAGGVVDGWLADKRATVAVEQARYAALAGTSRSGASA